jgi:hypothetical protein
MTGRGRLLVSGLVLGLLVAGAATATAIGPPATPSAAPTPVSVNLVEVSMGEVTGLIVAQQFRASTRAKVGVSLHNLTAKRSYRVAASTKTCSQIVDAADYTVWRKDFKMRDTDEVYQSGIVSRRNRLNTVHSVRLFVANPPSSGLRGQRGRGGRIADCPDPIGPGQAG